MCLLIVQFIWLKLHLLFETNRGNSKNISEIKLCTTFLVNTISIDEVKYLLFDDYLHDDGIKWKHFPWPFVRGIHRSPMDYSHEGQWREALNFTLNYAWTNDWANNIDAGDLRRRRAQYDVTLMVGLFSIPSAEVAMRCDEFYNHMQVFYDCSCAV